MTRKYYWISYNTETESYQTSGAPCVQTEVTSSTINLSIIRDLHFSGRISLGDTIKIKLVSVPNMRDVEARFVILNHFNTDNDNNDVKIEKDIEIPIPQSINQMIDSLPSDSWFFDTREFDSSSTYSTIRIVSGDFSMNLNFYNSSTSEEERKFFYYSHPNINLEVGRDVVSQTQ